MSKMDIIMQKVSNIGFNIRKIREAKGFSQEYLAQELSISQSSYARLENEDIQITVNRLLKIAEILETDIINFLTPNAQSFNIQNNHYGNGYVEKQIIENKDTTEKLISSYEERIKEYQERLKDKDEQIALLKSLIK